jgi:hypothetical protein
MTLVDEGMSDSPSSPLLLLETGIVVEDALESVDTTLIEVVTEMTLVDEGMSDSPSSPLLLLETGIVVEDALESVDTTLEVVTEMTLVDEGMSDSPSSPLLLLETGIVVEDALESVDTTLEVVIEMTLVDEGMSDSPLSPLLLLETGIVVEDALESVENTQQQLTEVMSSDLLSGDKSVQSIHDKIVTRKSTSNKKRHTRTTSRQKKLIPASGIILVQQELSPLQVSADVSFQIALAMQDWKHIYGANVQYRQLKRPGATKKKCMENNKRVTFVMEDFLSFNECAYSHHVLLSTADNICAICDHVTEETQANGWDILHNNSGNNNVMLLELFLLIFLR